MVPVETVREMQEAGLFRAAAQALGRLRAGPAVFYRVQMALAEGCMSTAWIYGVIGVHNWQLPSSPTRPSRMWGSNRGT
jgi:3-hydroxy-9,10-secoandrosta-1,3,5(10)-triene-9,17-dione monooxygenase